jgi:hypothetical protein
LRERKKLETPFWKGDFANVDACCATTLKAALGIGLNIQRYKLVATDFAMERFRLTLFVDRASDTLRKVVSKQSRYRMSHLSA